MVSKKAISVAVILLMFFALCSGLFAQQVFDGPDSGHEMSRQEFLTAEPTILNASWQGFGGVTTFSAGYGTNLYSSNIAPFYTLPNTSFNYTAYNLNNISFGTTYYATVEGIFGSRAITSIACGNTYTVALYTDGTVWAWGDNARGQLGDTTTIQRTTPVQVAFAANTYLSNIIAIAGGTNFTIALTSGGNVYTWGDNSFGQLGDTTTIERHAPVEVATAANTYLSGMTAIAGGDRGTIALKNDGTVWAWGDNSFGQLGDTTTINRSTPVQVAFAANNYISGITDIAGEGNSAVARQNDGTIWTWGLNTNGQLGDGTTTNRSTPVQVAIAANTYLTGILALAADGNGGGSTIAMKSDGSVWAWGLNSKGQLGDTTTIERHTAVQVATGAGTYLSGVIAVGANVLSSIALKNDGTVWTWGDNSNGELGDTTTIERHTPVQVATGAGTYLSGIVAIAGGSLFHTIALKNDGTLWDWGLNTNGQLGNGTTTSSSTAAQVTAIKGTLQIATSSGSVLAGFIGTSNNPVIFGGVFSTSAGCGALGLDALALLGLAYWLRRKKAKLKSL